jgi:hypothetical protein
MNHLAEETLNEYLDDALPSEARAEVEAHLRDCADCATHLTRLTQVFNALASLPDLEPGSDLASSVLQRLMPRPSVPRSIQRVLALQFIIALTALIVALPHLQNIFTTNVPSFTLPALPDLLTPFDQTISGFQIFLAQVNLPEPGLTINLSGLFMAVTVFSVTLLWLVGNGLLLRRPGTIK